MWKAFKFDPSFDFKVIVDIIFVIGVNPMAQSSQSMLYDSKLMMCQTMQGTPSLSGSVGFGFGRSKLKYNLYLYHYCNMDPEEARGALFTFLHSFSFDAIQFWFVSCSSSSGSCIGVGCDGGVDPFPVRLLRLQNPQQNFAPRQSQHLLGQATGQGVRGAGCTELGE